MPKSGSGVTGVAAAIWAPVKKVGETSGVIRNLVWLLGIAGAVSLGFILILKDHRQVALIVGFALFLCVSFGLGYLTHRALQRRQGGDLGYKIISLQYTYSFDEEDPRKQFQVTTIEIEALRDGVGIYRGHYGWTGTGDDPGPVMLTNNASIVTTLPYAAAGWRRLYIIFNKPLPYGRRVDFSYRHDLFDRSGTFVPFVAKTLNEHVERLALRVSFPNKYLPRGQITACQRSVNPASDHVFKEQELTLDEITRSVELVLGNPTKGIKYSIEWQWQEYSNYCNRLTLP